MKKTLLFMVAALVFVILGATSVMLISGWMGGTAQESKGTIKKSIPYNPGEAFITNLKDSKKLLKASIIIEVGNKKQISIMQNNNYKVRDLIIDILSNLTDDDVKDEGFKDKVKKDICESLQAKLDLHEIIDVYFNDFVTQ